jgi:type II secretory pathway pseudopilin PulG
MLLELVAACAVLVLVTVIARWTWVRWRGQQFEVCVTEEQARENAAPLTRAIRPGSGRERTGR